MSHTIAISNEQYERLEALASQHSQTPEETLAALLRDALPRNGHQPEASDDLENSPLFQIAGIFTGDIEPGWTERHDEIYSPLFQIAGIFTGSIEPGWTERHDDIFGGEA